jgi:hypothetical protein
LRKGLLEQKKRNNTNVTNELIHPRFEMANNDLQQFKDTVPNSLLNVFQRKNDVLYLIFQMAFNQRENTF